MSVRALARVHTFVAIWSCTKHEGLTVVYVYTYTYVMTSQRATHSTDLTGGQDKCLSQMHVPTQMLTTCKMRINTDSWEETFVTPHTYRDD